MSAKSQVEDLRFDSPAHYQICVGGRIGPMWSDRLEGMHIELLIGGNDSVVTTLSGDLSDQAALAGLLRTLYELHLPLLSVNCLTLLPSPNSYQTVKNSVLSKED